MFTPLNCHYIFCVKQSIPKNTELRYVDTNFQKDAAKSDHAT